MRSDPSPAAPDKLNAYGLVRFWVAGGLGDRKEKSFMLRHVGVNVRDLVQAKGEPVIGIIIDERRVHVTAWEHQYLIQWFQPPVETRLLTTQSWRISKKLTLLSEG